MIHHRKAQPESAIKSSIAQYLRFKGWMVVNIMQGPLSHKGISDLICIKCDKVVFAEVKTQVGRLSPHQEKFRDDLKAKGGLFFVLRSIEDAQSMEREVGL